jgi:Tol biopolymer transport system component
MSHDGRFVVFVEGISPWRLSVWDTSATGVIYSFTPTNDFAPPHNITVSPNGQRVAFSYSDGAEEYLEILDPMANTNWVIDFDTASQTSSNAPIWVALRFNANGTTLACTLSKGQTPTRQVYCYDLEAGTKTLLSKGFYSGVEGAGDSDTPDVSPDGRWVLFRSEANDLVPSDTNSASDVFLYDRQNGMTTLLSVNALGEASGNNRSSLPRFTGNGQMVLFMSRASDLAKGDLNQETDLFALTQPFTNVFPPLYQTIGVLPAFGPKPVLSWPLIPGGVYQVQFKNDLSEMVWRLANVSLGGMGSRGYALDIEPTAGSKFYRVVAH